MKKFILLLSTLLVTLQVEATGPQRQVILNADGTYTVLDHPGYGCCSDVGIGTPRLIDSKAFSGSGADGLTPYGTTASGVVKTIGSPTIPIIMVGFPDLPFMEETTKEKVSRMFNEAGYHDYDYISSSGTKTIKCHGSVRDYFLSQSHGLFQPNFVVVDSITANMGYAYYGKPSATQNDSHVSELVTEACQKAYDHGADFSETWASPHTTPLVIIYHAGQGQHAAYDEHWEDYIWAHFKQESRATTDEQQIFSSYYIGNEALGVYVKGGDGNPVLNNLCLAGPGVLIHELGHAIGLPDFYDTKDNSKTGTPNYWSVMDYGQYYQNGYNPVGYSCYERALVGWQDYKCLGNEAEACELSASECYILKDPGNETKFYVLENRQADNVWYPNSLGSGLLVHKVNFDRSAWNNNRVNYNDTRRMVVIPADGESQNHRTYGGDWTKFQNDLFPGNAKGYTSFTPDFSTETDDYGCYNITLENGVISFNYRDKSTGIRSVEKASSQRVYDLQGRAASTNGHGIYIINGKKIIK